MFDSYGVLHNSSEVLEKDCYVKVGHESLEMMNKK